MEDPIVTIDRKRRVHGSFIGVTVLGFVVLVGSVTLFGDGAFQNLDGFMMLFLGFTIACVCILVAIWIRSRWICVAVLDDTGAIASTMACKHDLSWEELVGARTYSKVLKDAKKVQVRVLLLLEDGRCLEAPVDHDQVNPLYRIVCSAKFNTGSEGQRMGIIKCLTTVLLGSAAMILGIWWAEHVVDQFTNGVLFQGNIKAILLKLAFAIAGPIGGLGCIGWGLYHAIARPILYKPGYLSSQEESPG